MLRRLVALLPLALLLPGAAHAAPWSEREPTRDVIRTTFSEEPKPCGTVIERRVRGERTTDITRLGASSDARGIRLTLGLRSLSTEGYLAVTFALRTSKGTFEARVIRYRTGAEPDVSVGEMWDYAALDELAAEAEATCESYSFGDTTIWCGATVDLDIDHDEVVVHLPRGCLDRARWARVGASVLNVPRPSVDTWTEDVWQPRGAPLLGAEQRAYGPRVRTGASR